MESRNKYTANRFDDHIFQRTSDKCIIMLNKSCNKPGNISPLFYGVLKQYLLLQNLSRIRSAYFDLGMYNRYVQRRCIDTYNIKRRNRPDKGNASINTRRDIISMFYTA